ncbi:MAG: hypothetical protein Devi2KO_37720 [Devosia indica]
MIWKKNKQNTSTYKTIEKKKRKKTNRQNSSRKKKKETNGNKLNMNNKVN